MPKSAAQQIVDNLLAINAELAPTLSKTFEHTDFVLTPQDQHMLREHLLNLHAQISMMALEVAEIDIERNSRRIRLPFKK